MIGNRIPVVHPWRSQSLYQREQEQQPGEQGEEPVGPHDLPGGAREPRDGLPQRDDAPGDDGRKQSEQRDRM